MKVPVVVQIARPITTHIATEGPEIHSQTLRPRMSALPQAGLSTPKAPNAMWNRPRESLNHAGPSVAMCVVIGLAIWTTTGTFMLLFIAALQDLPVEVDEAAMLDGVSPWQKLRLVTLPMIKPTLFLVITLGLIGTWQVFDQIYVMGKGAPAGTTLTPAYLSYQESFRSLKYGTGAAMAFIVFVIIVLLTWFQRWLMREDRGTSRRTRRAAAVAVGMQQGKQAGGPS